MKALCVFEVMCSNIGLMRLIRHFSTTFHFGALENFENLRTAKMISLRVPQSWWEKNYREAIRPWNLHGSNLEQSKAHLLVCEVST
jgi:hypothetical protein